MGYYNSQISKLSFPILIFFLISSTFPSSVLGDDYNLACDPVPVRSCPGVEPSERATLVDVYIQDCLEEPCSVYRGENATMQMDIEFHDTVTIMKAELHALLGGLPIPWDGINEDACGDIISEGDECPLQNGDYITYGVNLYVEPVYPKVRTDVRYRILDENDEVLVCWIAKMEVTDSSDSDGPRPCPAKRAREED